MLPEYNRLEGKSKVTFIIQGIKSMYGVDIENYLGKIIYLDAITHNGDRHLNNIDFILDNGTLLPAPVLDNGLGLLSDTTKYPINNRDLLIVASKVKAKPFSTDFKKQCGYFNTPLLRIRYSDFLNDLENKYVEFKEEEYQRALKVLKMNMERFRGIAWESI